MLELEVLPEQGLASEQIEFLLGESGAKATVARRDIQRQGDTGDEIFRWRHFFVWFHGSCRGEKSVLVGRPPLTSGWSPGGIQQTKSPSSSSTLYVIASLHLDRRDGKKGAKNCHFLGNQLKTWTRARALILPECCLSSRSHLVVPIAPSFLDVHYRNQTHYPMFNFRPGFLRR